MKNTLSIALVIVTLCPTAAAFAQTTNHQTPDVLDTRCVKTLLEIREDALKTAYNAHTAKINTIMDTRKAALLAAVDQTTAKLRSTARKIARSEAKQAVKLANIDLRKARVEILTTYKTQMSKCTGGTADARQERVSAGSNPTDL